MIKLKSKFKLSSLFSFFLWIFLFSGYPVVFSFACGVPYMIPMLFSALCLCALLLCNKRRKSLRSIDFIFILNLLFWGGQLLFHNDSGYISNIVQIILVYIFYLSVLNGPSIISFSKQYVYLMTTITVVGAVSMFAIFLFNIPPLLTYAAHDGRAAYLFPFTATNTYYQLAHPVIRFSGIFDEPGAVAFYSMFALLMNRFIIQSKKVETLLLCSPLFTFSVAHFFTVFFYTILFKTIKVKYWVITVLLIMSSIALINSLKYTEFDAVYKLTVYRFEQNDDGEVHGDNRTDNAINALAYWKEKPIAGYGKSYFEDKIGEVGFNIFYVGAMYGILGYIFIYSFWSWGITKSIWCRKTKTGRDALKCYGIIFINMLQRPLITNVLELSVVLLFVLITIQHTYNSEKKYINV